MSDFWAQRLGQVPPTQQQQQQPLAPAPPAATRPWWVPQQVPPQTTSIVPQAAPQQQIPAPQAVSVDPNVQTDIGTLLRQDGYTTTKAQSAMDTESCPACGSTNYMRANGHPNSMKQCFECGNNPRFEQMAGGTSGIPTKGPVRAARVQNPDIGAPKMGTVFQHI